MFQLSPRSSDPSSPSDFMSGRDSPRSPPTTGHPSDEEAASQLLSVRQYHDEHQRRHGSGSVSQRPSESEAPRSPEPPGSPTQHGELESGEVATGEVAGNPASSSHELWTPNPFPSRSWSASNALRNAPPLSSRYEDELPEPGVITNDLDGAQSRQFAAEAHARPNRPVARPIVGTSRRDYGYVRSSAAEAARRAALQPLDTYTCGPAARTTDEVVQRQTLHERYLTPQVTTPAEYRERLRQQLKGEPVPSMQTVPVVLAEGETTGAYEAQFQNWISA
ncbi:hypothetical protein F443_13973 [Phytophthora nicotianae P1569]|uniref:Uncharacterized protein n=1 Tax=Phytophthora nicotianae P1569 TaxID=1317065 RepID=V9EN65_PHYNI|nr:hypothetical protein F443_13973 [Phytophthora nicotianae P1569]